MFQKTVDVFLLQRSSGTLIIKRLESQIILKSLWVSKPNSLSKIGKGHPWQKGGNLLFFSWQLH